VRRNCSRRNKFGHIFPGVGFLIKYSRKFEANKRLQCSSRAFLEVLPRARALEKEKSDMKCRESYRRREDRRYYQSLLILAPLARSTTRPTHACSRRRDSGPLNRLTRISLSSSPHLPRPGSEFSESKGPLAEVSVVWPPHLPTCALGIWWICNRAGWPSTLLPPISPRCDWYIGIFCLDTLQ
jgi:hypothetical protein